ncbi:hypothetical protein SAMN05444370_11460 [Rubrimonas cliftonensis]|uniref:Uncharacterized protein n=1 Tax=Rubrimonas cliftonensis TaxID=89524 RepID=A0A1H4EL73_9RHOB|nr:hypothetical protein SAMN05444370_11460 [Rubrimonas cliftonensis]
MAAPWSPRSPQGETRAPGSDGLRLSGHGKRVKSARAGFAMARAMPTVRATGAKWRFRAAETCSTRGRMRARPASPRATWRSVGTPRANPERPLRERMCEALAPTSRPPRQPDAPARREQRLDSRRLHHPQGGGRGRRAAARHPRPSRAAGGRCGAFRRDRCGRRSLRPSRRLRWRPERAAVRRGFRAVALAEPHHVPSARAPSPRSCAKTAWRDRGGRPPAANEVRHVGPNRAGILRGSGRDCSFRAIFQVEIAEMRNGRRHAAPAGSSPPPGRPAGCAHRAAPKWRARWSMSALTLAGMWRLGG